MQAQLPQTATQQLPLRDIHLPQEPGFWPLAPGWWLLIVLTSILLVFLLIKLNQYRIKKNRYRLINQQLSTLHFQFKKDQDYHLLASSVSAFLRRFVCFQLKQESATSLTGKHWLAFLNKDQATCPFNPFQQALVSGAYQPDTKYDDEQLIQTVRAYIKQHILKPKKPGAKHV